MGSGGERTNGLGVFPLVKGDGLGIVWWWWWCVSGVVVCRVVGVVLLVE